ncbi:hypothetical protein [Halapricum salinum]|uniref:DUF7979 domain-containing protein n=1 Tax=Halapricum salinum TaxID=1457250 RepID=A0A4D6H7D8_9EURY|nr:hypothetical protein [Halapricum salinum]QCC49703.1 hypothetical protein DV733_00010 [Halapricum salinum]
MASSLVWGILIPVAAVVFAVGGIVAFAYRSSLTRYHVPAIALTLLAVTSGLTIAFGIVSAEDEADQVNYTASPCEDSRYRGTTASERLKYSSLSPATQDVFRSALEADGEYTTTTRPPEFEYQGDVGTVLNRISYESECYLLHADSGGSLGLGLFVAFLLFVGGPLTLLALSVGLGGLRWGLFTLPMSMVTGVVVGVLAVAVGRWPGEVLAWAAITAALTWLVLKVVDSRRSETFRERMET